MIRRSFDLLARPYRLLEYVCFGPALQRARTALLHAVPDRHHALVLGDGDGRFLATLLQAQPQLRILAVDGSVAMLAALRRRCGPLAPLRLRTTWADARTLTLPPESMFDLICTHFFLDCLTTPEIAGLIERLRPHLSPGALWLLSDFRIPRRPWPLRLAARLLTRLLYAAFRLLTGLEVQRLPEYAAAFAGGGLRLCSQKLSLGGLLTTEVWHLPASNDGVSCQETPPCPIPTTLTSRSPTTSTR